MKASDTLDPRPIAAYLENFSNMTIARQEAEKYLPKTLDIVAMGEELAGMPDLLLSSLYVQIMAS